MLNREEFKKYIGMIDNYNKFYNTLDKAFKTNNSDNQIMSGDEFLNGFTKLLSLAMNDNLEDSWIEYYLYDMPKDGGHITYGEDEFVLKNIDDLYDFLVYNESVKNDELRCEDSEVVMTYNSDEGHEYELLENITINKGSRFYPSPYKTEYKVPANDYIVGVDIDDVGIFTITNADKLPKLFKKV